MMNVRVKTVEPSHPSKDWDPVALLTRKWDVNGKIVDVSDSHGTVYQVKHEDGTVAWYEPRELKLV